MGVTTSTGARSREYGCSNLHRSQGQVRPEYWVYGGNMGLTYRSQTQVRQEPEETGCAGIPYTCRL